MARERTQKKQPKKSSPQTRPETQMQQNTVNSSVLWLGSRARAKRPENQRKKSKDRAAREPATAKAKRAEQQPNAQHSSFWRYLQRFVENEDPASPACPAALGAKMRKNEPRLYPSDTYLKTVLFGWRGFLEGSLDDADQAPLKHHPGPTPDPDDVSHMA